MIRQAGGHRGGAGLPAAIALRGGKVVTIPHVEDRSTINIVNRIHGGK